MGAEILFEFPVAVRDLKICVHYINIAGHFIEKVFVVFFRYRISAFLTVGIETDMLVQVISLQLPVDVEIKGSGC